MPEGYGAKRCRKRKFTAFLIGTRYGKHANGGGSLFPAFDALRVQILMNALFIKNLRVPAVRALPIFADRNHDTDSS